MARSHHNVPDLSDGEAALLAGVAILSLSAIGAIATLPPAIVISKLAKISFLKALLWTVTGISGTALTWLLIRQEMKEAESLPFR